MTLAEVKYNLDILEKHADKQDAKTWEEFTEIFLSQTALLPSSSETRSLAKRITSLPKPFQTTEKNNTARSSTPLTPSSKSPTSIPANMRHVRIPGDGHCLFRAIATGLNYMGLTTSKGIGSDDQVQQLRDRACKKNEQLLKETTSLSVTDQIAQEGLTVELEGNPDYFTKMRSTSTYGSALECKALADLYRVQINVISENPKDANYTYNENNELPHITLYYRNNNHYDLLVPQECNEIDL